MQVSSCHYYSVTKTHLNVSANDCPCNKSIVTPFEISKDRLLVGYTAYTYNTVSPLLRIWQGWAKLVFTEPPFILSLL